MGYLIEVEDGTAHLSSVRHPVDRRYVVHSVLHSVVHANLALLEDEDLKLSNNASLVGTNLSHVKAGASL